MRNVRMSRRWLRRRPRAPEVDWRDRFSDEEWAQIRHLPVDVYYLDPLLDAKVDDNHAGWFIEERAPSSMLNDSLHRALVEDLGPDRLPEEMRFQRRETDEEFRPRLQRTRELLKDRLTAQELQSFIGSVLITAVKVYGLRMTGPAQFEAAESSLDAEDEGHRVRRIQELARGFGIDLNGARKVFAKQYGAD